MYCGGDGEVEGDWISEGWVGREGEGGRRFGLLLDGWMKGTSVIIIHLAQHTILETLSETVVLFEFLERSLCDARSFSCPFMVLLEVHAEGRVGSR